MLISGLFILLFISAISSKRINGITINRAAALVLLYSFIISIDTLNVSIIGSGIGVYGGLYQVTVLSKIVESFIYILGAMILSNTMIIDSKNELNKISVRSEYSIIALFTVVGGILLINSNDLVSMYLSIELQSFGLYVLATIYRDSQAATYAGLKYFLLGGLSSGFILLGSSIIYAYTGVTNLESIYLLISEGSSINLSTATTENTIELSSFDLNNFNSFVQIGLLVMTVGFLFKIASAPFHNWAADVYDGVPVKVTTWLAIMAKISILTFLLDLVLATSNLGDIEGILALNLTNLILIASLLSLLVGTIVGLAQSRIKRLLAYSTISHVGFLLLAIAINTQDSTESFIFYLIQYSLTSANAFFVLIAFGSLSSSKNKGAPLSIDDNNAEKEYSPIQFISQLRGQFNASEPSPLLALAMAIILFSMAGIPPLVGFFAKQAVLLAAVKNGYIFLALIGIITSVISAAYYLRVIKVMVFDPETDNQLTETVDNKISASLATEKALLPIQIRLSNSLSFSISVLTVLTLFFVLKPTLILNSAHIMALSLFYL
jgi:NADH-ubiquinone oxidoreductase chain 2